MLAGFLGYLLARSPAREIVINRREEIVIDEGINNVEIANRTRASLVRIYGRRTQAAGVIVTSDGVIAVPAAALPSRDGLSAVLAEERVAPAKFLAEDEMTGLAFVQLEEKNLPVMRQGFSAELRAGERVLQIAPSTLPNGAEVSAALVKTPAYAVPSLTAIYNLAKPNAYLPLDPAPQKLGAVIVNRDGAMIGFVMQIGKETAVLRAEDYKSAVDRLLNKEQAKIFNVSYNILSPALAELSGLPKQYGILVKDASQALLPGDFVTTVDAVALSEKEDFQGVLLRKKARDTVKMQIFRGGVEKEVEITL